ncbi:glutamyl-tRNA reductase [Chlamydia sp. 17-3921]|uniref:glutamyl-tRNA reductase n=1 Tax=Chlamydia sp. 17-3921 TaxID=2675798 RepID=UPI00191A21B9|nr:glutamyl-tRNA reductase [Chlamydia sp. 17-3921]
MVLGVVGVSYREAELKDRERVILLLEALETDPCLLQRVFGPNSAFILLLTCHRAEIYYYSENPELSLSAFLFQYTVLGVSPYSYQGCACFEHLFRVTSGVDSLILGETEIQGQVKRAYLKAASSRQLPFDLHFLFQKALKEGKTLRSRVSFPSSEASMESVVLEIIRMYGKSKKSTLLFVGYSEINRKIATSLYNMGFLQITFCSRQIVKPPYATISHSDLSFRDSYEIIFFGSAKLPKYFCNFSLESLSSIPNRLIFDFNVPRTFLWQDNLKEIIYFDMDFISKGIQKKLQKNKLCIDAKKFSLDLTAKKQWEIYQKKSFHIFQNKIFHSHQNSVVSH